MTTVLLLEGRKGFSLERRHFKVPKLLLVLERLNIPVEGSPMDNEVAGSIHLI